MGWIFHLPRLYLALAAAALFVAAVTLSWTQGANHLWVQGVAMVLALAAFGLAAVASMGKAR
ncbi:MAG TPA: hypothetical protein VNF75_04835 [Candidatus Dormibacteraeota bacterium]|nr:hypothetical protein [Candidatus Dormibacteraeota bacterium]